MMKHFVYLSLGSNLGDREKTLEKAMDEIEKRIGKITSHSAFYYSEPWGFSSENGFVNNCLLLETNFTPELVLSETQAIEIDLGRTQKSNGVYKDRVVDIDILFYDSQVIQTPQLTIPHPLLTERAFVLEPLNEIAPDFIHPIFQKSIKQLTKLLS